MKKFWAIIMAALLVLGQAEVIEAAAGAKPAITNGGRAEADQYPLW